MIKEKNWLCWLILSFIVAITIAITIICGIGIHKRNIETLNNPPSKNYIEEDLEEVFMTTFVVVLEQEQEYDIIYYNIEANGLYYRVEYVCELNNCNRQWVYSKYVPINDYIPEYVEEELCNILELHNGEQCYFVLDRTTDGKYIATLYYMGIDPHLYTKQYIITENGKQTVWGEE